MDLDDLALLVGSRLAEIGVRVSSASVTPRSPDMLFAYPDVELDALIEVVAATAPKLAFLSTESFDSEEFETDDKELRQMAVDHDGDLFSLSVTWAADGIVHAWFASAPWHDTLTYEKELIDYQARGVDRVEYELRMENNRNAWQRLMALVLTSAAFRGASTNRRTAQVQLVMDAHPELVAELVFPRDLIKRARQAAALEVAQWEAKLAEDKQLLDDVVVLLRRSRTVADQKAQIAELLKARTDGWLPTEAFIDRLRRDATDRNRR